MHGCLAPACTLHALSKAHWHCPEEHAGANIMGITACGNGCTTGSLEALGIIKQINRGTGSSSLKPSPLNVTGEHS